MESESANTGMHTQYKETAFERVQSASNVRGLSNDSTLDLWVGASALAALPDTETGEDKYFLVQQVPASQIRDSRYLPDSRVLSLGEQPDPFSFGSSQ